MPWLGQSIKLYLCKDLLTVFRCVKLALAHMWNGPAVKVLLRSPPSDGAVICPAYGCGHGPLATIRSATPIAKSISRARRRRESDGLIGIEV